MNLEQIRKQFTDKMNSYENKWDKDSRFFHLIEEVGELSEIFLQYKGIKKPCKNLHDIKIALADVLDDILALTILYKINFQDLFEEVLKHDRENK